MNEKVDEEAEVLPSYIQQKKAMGKRKVMEKESIFAIRSFISSFLFSII